MRIQFINNQIAIGGAMRDESALQTVINKGITHIIDLDYQCDASFELAKECGIEVLHYHLPDDGEEKPYRYFAACVEFALNVLCNKEHKLFIHCAAGRSRSVSIAYAILRIQGNSREKAKNIIGLKYSLPLSIRDLNFKAIRRIRYEEDAEIFLERYNDSVMRQHDYLMSEAIKALPDWSVRNRIDILNAIDWEIDRIEKGASVDDMGMNTLCKIMNENCIACPFTSLRKIISCDYSLESYEMLKNFVQFAYPETRMELLYKARVHLALTG